MVVRKLPMSERLTKYVIDDNGCWLWTGAKSVEGYGHMRSSDNGHVYSERAHRASFALHVRPIKPGEHICHHCDRPSCINPDHLYAGDPTTNGADKARRKRARTTPKSGVNNPMYGRSGTLNPFFGKHHTDASKQKMLATRRANRIAAPAEMPDV